MKLKKYAKIIEELAAKYPNAEVIYSSDDEGNDFDKVVFSPTLGNYKSRDEFVPENQFKDYEDEKLKVNAVCIN